MKDQAAEIVFVISCWIIPVALFCGLSLNEAILFGIWMTLLCIGLKIGIMEDECTGDVLIKTWGDENE